MLQSIQEETATNIYFPSPLHGFVGPDVANMSAVPPTPGSPPRMNKNAIWITGEFFGVQRARDMLLQVALTKVCPPRLFICVSILTLCAYWVV